MFRIIAVNTWALGSLKAQSESGSSSIGSKPGWLCGAAVSGSLIVVLGCVTYT